MSVISYRRKYFSRMRIKNRKYISLLLLLLFLFTRGVEYSHQFFHQDERHCHEYNSKHLHPKESHCSLCEYLTNTQYSASVSYFHHSVIELTEIYFNIYFSNAPSQYTVRHSLRGPPVLFS